MVLLILLEIVRAETPVTRLSTTSLVSNQHSVTGNNVPFERLLISGE